MKQVHNQYNNVHFIFTRQQHHSRYLYLYHLSCFPDKSNGEIRQLPVIYANSSSNVTLTCAHDNLDHYRLFWYKQTKEDVGLTLLIISVGQNQVEIEAPFKTPDSKYTATRPEIKISTLQITKLESEDSALYYCATSTQYHITAALLNNNHNTDSLSRTGICRIIMWLVNIIVITFKGRYMKKHCFTICLHFSLEKGKWLKRLD